MKKLVFIFLVLFCLTGCDNSVEFEFDDDIKTKVSVSFTLDEYKARLDEPNLSDDEIKSRIQSMIDFRNAFTEPYSDLFEEKSFVNKGNSYNGVYEYTYTYSNFNDSSVLNNCFESFGVHEEKDKFYVFLSGKSKCAPFKLIVKADNRMLSSNENVKDGNKYVWNVQESNNDIYMTISKTTINDKTPSKKPTKEKEKKSSTFDVIDIIGIVVALIVGVVVFIVNKKFKESD